MYTDLFTAKIYQENRDTRSNERCPLREVPLYCHCRRILLSFIRYDDSQLCSCIDTYNCTYPSGIYSSLTAYHSYLYQGILIPPMTSEAQIPGSQVGCMPSTSIMESTLECFYTNDCLFQLFPLTNQTALNSSITSQFSMETKIGSIIQELFLENFSSQKNFSAFFQACQPHSCTYSYNARGHIAFIITTILSLVGGLAFALKILASLLVTIYRMVQQRFQQRSSPISFITTTDNQSTLI